MKNLRRSRCVFLLYICAFQPVLGQAPEIGIRSSQAERDSPIEIEEQRSAALLQTIPAEVRSIRERQVAIADRRQVELTFRDRGLMSETAIRGVPSDLSDIVIKNDDHLTVLVNTLYPLFGFESNEQLVYFEKSGNGYVFKEQINGLIVEPGLINVVLGTHNRILAIRGTAIIDRNFRADHSLDAQGAVNTVDRFLLEMGLPAPLNPDPGDTQAYLIYKHWDDGRTLSPWWFVGKAAGGEYYVDPNGLVSSAVEITP